MKTESEYPIVTDTVMITKDLNIQQIVELCNIDADLIRTLNPQYKTDIIPGYSKPSSLCLPQKELNRFLDLGDSIYNYKTEIYQKKRYEVEVDETEIPVERQRYSSTYTRSSKSKNNSRHLSKKERQREKARHKDSSSKRDKKKSSSQKHAKNSKKKSSKKNESKPSKHNSKSNKKGKKRR